MQIKQKKRENIPYLIEKIQRKNIISGLTRVIGTRFFHQKDLNRLLGFPAHKSSKINKLTSIQKKNYVYNLNKYNFFYEDKDREEIDSRLALITIRSYRQWRFNHGLPCRGQRTKTNASTAYYRVNARITQNIIKKQRSKANKSFSNTFKQVSKNTYNRTT